nr:hypothetical protein [Tanacetum cinerariifolium]
SSSLNLLLRKRYRDISELIEDTEGESSKPDFERKGSEDESSDSDDEREATSEPLGLGYGAARRRALELTKEITLSTYEVMQSSRSVPERFRDDDGIPRGTNEKQVPTRFDTAQAPQGLMQCNNITTKDTSSINIATKNISTKALRASCNTSKAAWYRDISELIEDTEGESSKPDSERKGSEDESSDSDDEREAASEPIGLGYGAARRRALKLTKEITLSTYEDGRVYTNILTYAPPAAPVQTPPSPEWSSGQTNAQMIALWHAIYDIQRENHDLRRQLAEERRERLELTDHVARMERRQESGGSSRLYEILD